MQRDRPSSVPRSSTFATEQLRQLMMAADIPSFRALARQAGVSDWSVTQLRRDRVAAMRVDILQKIAAALGVSLTELLGEFGAIAETHDDSPPASKAMAAESVVTLKAEYQRLQTQLEHQSDELRRQFQTEALTVLESWLVQWPTVSQAVAKNPDLPASRVVPLVQPVQDLMAHWGVEAIAPVGAEIPFDPQQHQLMSGTAHPGDRVKVRYTGFRQGETLLHRAKVSPVT